MTTKTTYEATVIQYLRPHGYPKKVTTELPIETESLYQDMLSINYRFESEVLTTKEVCTSISNEEGDVDSTITKNGPEVQEGMISMLKRKKWEDQIIHNFDKQA